MKNPDRKIVSSLECLPNIGKAIAADLLLIGIDHPQQLMAKDPFALYERLCHVTGNQQDPCVLDVFISAVDFMEGGDPHPWWFFTQERKKFLKNKGK